jgi:hypothetical protein
VRIAAILPDDQTPAPRRHAVGERAGPEADGLAAGEAAIVPEDDDGGHDGDRK